jgi:hypothetical protein
MTKRKNFPPLGFFLAAPHFLGLCANGTAARHKSITNTSYVKYAKRMLLWHEVCPQNLLKVAMKTPDRPPHPPGPSLTDRAKAAQQARMSRQAAALRENLRRRKQQERAKQAKPPGAEDT